MGKNDKAAGHVENGFYLAAFFGRDCRSAFGRDHAQKVLAELAVQNQDEQGRMHVACKDKASEHRKVQENVGEGIEHFSKVADLAVSAREASVKVVGDFRRRQKGNHGRGQKKARGRAFSKAQPARQKVKYKKNWSGDYSRQSEFIRRFHVCRIHFFLSIINTKNTRA